jgi:mevalonate kinase
LSAHFATTSAPGKIIITGEHFVVHGSYALAAAINKRATVRVSGSSGHDSEIISDGRRSSVSSEDGVFTAAKAVIRKIVAESGNRKEIFRVEISSQIPVGSGLGSSSAISVATAAALVSYLGQRRDLDRISELAHAGEKAVHGNPSGIDTAASLYGGMLLFDRKNQVRPVLVNTALKILVVFSGTTRRTAALISKVNGLRTRYPATFEHLSDASSFLSLQAAEAIAKGDLPRLGELMNLSQASLSWIGVSTSALDKLINEILHSNVYGAKLTGAGGGGSVIAVPKPERAEDILKQVSQAHKISFLTSIPQEGLRWEI